MKKHCEGCGRLFKTYRGSQKYCSYVCYAEHNIMNPDTRKRAKEKFEVYERRIKLVAHYLKGNKVN